LNVFLADFAGANGGEWGAMNWDNRGVIPLLEELAGTSDADRHRELAQQVSTTLAAELPVIPILFYTQQTAVNTRVANFSFDPFERSFRIAAMELR